LLEAVTDSINDNPQLYDEIFTAIQKMAIVHGIDISDISIPDRLPNPRRSIVNRAATPRGDNKISFDISGDSVSLENIADAVKLLEQITPSPARKTASRSSDRLVVHEAESVGFRTGEAGAEALSAGWAPPAKWGTWSVARHASLRFSIDSKTEFPASSPSSFRAFLRGEHAS